MKMLDEVTETEAEPLKPLELADILAEPAPEIGTV